THRTKICSATITPEGNFNYLLIKCQGNVIALAAYPPKDNIMIIIALGISHSILAAYNVINIIDVIQHIPMLYNNSNVCFLIIIWKNLIVLKYN
ncbi:MAG TPA: hypothetical protein PLA73_05575, partial [Sedimentibacter sp.]|nr:hypothetical protein [Sedimentibacter sp.]